MKLAFCELGLLFEDLVLNKRIYYLFIFFFKKRIKNQKCEEEK
jgi:hypothetical protein